MKVFSFSSGANKKFPNNAPADFRISLPEEIETEGCEAALLELGFRARERGYAIEVPTNVPLFCFALSHRGAISYHNDLRVFPGIYSSEKHLLTILYRYLKLAGLSPVWDKGGIICVFAYPYRRGHFTPLYTLSAIELDQLKKKGINGRLLTRRVAETFKVTNPPPSGCKVVRFDAIEQPKKPSFAFFYCDVIRPHLTGDTVTQSMRTIPIEKTSGLQHIAFEKPFFFPTAKDSVREVRVVLKDEYGKDVDVVADSIYASIGIRPVSI